jgi:hypothetical protein
MPDADDAAVVETSELTDFGAMAVTETRTPVVRKVDEGVEDHYRTALAWRESASAGATTTAFTESRPWRTSMPVI